MAMKPGVIGVGFCGSMGHSDGRGWVERQSRASAPNSNPFILGPSTVSVIDTATSMTLMSDWIWASRLSPLVFGRPGEAPVMTSGIDGSFFSGIWYKVGNGCGDKITS